MLSHTHICTSSFYPPLAGTISQGSERNSSQINYGSTLLMWSCKQILHHQHKIVHEKGREVSQFQNIREFNFEIVGHVYDLTNTL